MPRRKSKDENGAWLVVVLICLAVLYFVLSAFLTISVYATLPTIVVGLIVLEPLARSRPDAASYQRLISGDCYLQEEISDLQILKEAQDKLEVQKRELYLQGDSLGVIRRISDNRFDGRERGRGLNAA